MTIQVGSISHGTLRPQDLIPAFIEALPAPDQREWWQRLARQLLQYGEVSYLGTLAEVRAGLETALEEYAASEGLVFGTLEGDGSDFGFWLPPCEYCGGSTEECADGICERALEAEDAALGVVE